MYNFEHLSTDYVYVIGDVMIDHYIYGNCDRISPEAPVPVVDVTNEDYTLGGAGNVVKNLASLGANTGLITVCGQDDGFEKINKSLRGLKDVRHQLVIDKSRTTTVKTRVVSSKHQLIRIDREDRHYIDDSIAEKIIEELKKHIEKIKIVIISDYSKGVLSERVIYNIIDICKRHQVKTIVDSKDPILSKYLDATIIKPNRKEASIATGIKIVDEDTLIAACKKIAEMTLCEAVVITLSDEGMAIFHDSMLTRLPTKALDIFDVTGAGDTVVAAIAFALINNVTLIDACNFANQAAAIVVAKIGSATATLDEINSISK